METIYILSPPLIILSGIFVIYVRFKQNKKLNSILLAVANKYKCDSGNFRKKSLFTTPKIYGTANKIPLDITEIKELGTIYLRIKLTCSIPHTGRFTIKKTNTHFWNNYKANPDDIPTGDESFDKKMLISGPSVIPVAALLNEEERTKIINAAQDAVPFKIDKTGIEVSYFRDSITSTEIFSSNIDQLLSIAASLSQEISRKEKLTENIQNEKMDEVIINNIKALASEYKNDEETKIVLQEALTSKSITVQIETADHLGSIGMQHLHVLLEQKNSLTDIEKIQIVDTLAANKYRQSIPLFKKIYLEENNTGLQRLILAAFRVFADQTVEPFLLEQMENKNVDLRHGAIEALGTCGTVASAEKLYHLANDFMNPFTNEYAQKAFSQIQSRLGNVEKGWLSVTDSPESEGALSITDDSTEGALSLDTESKKKS